MTENGLRLPRQPPRCARREPCSGGSYSSGGSASQVTPAQAEISPRLSLRPVLPRTRQLRSTSVTMCQAAVGAHVHTAAVAPSRSVCGHSTSHEPTLSGGCLCILVVMWNTASRTGRRVLRCSLQVGRVGGSEAGRTLAAPPSFCAAPPSLDSPPFNSIVAISLSKTHCASGPHSLNSELVLEGRTRGG